MEKYEWSDSGLELLANIKKEIQKSGGIEATTATLKCEWKYLYLDELNEMFKILYFRHDMKSLAIIFKIPLRYIYTWACSLGLKRSQTLRRLLRTPHVHCVEVLDTETGIYYTCLRDVARAFNVHINAIYYKKWIDERFFRI